MKKPDFTKIKNQATEIKQKASDLRVEAFKHADGLKKGVQAGVEVSKTVVQRTGGILNKNNLSHGLDAVAKGTDTVAKTMERASSQLKKFSKKLKGE